MLKVALPLARRRVRLVVRSWADRSARRLAV
jgi:hypothetical protein